jgi:uncharacterized delta-60 repeat protein
MGAGLYFRRRGRALALVAALLLVAAACDFAVGTGTGELDSAFGEGDGSAVLGGLRIRTDDTMTSTARLPDGRVVALGAIGYEGWGVTRYLPDGTIDQSFGNDGVATVGLEPMGDIAVASDGAVLVPGRVYQSAVWGVARLLPDGAPDPGFGVYGVAVLDVAGASGQNWTIGVATSGDRTYLLAWAFQGTGATVDTIVLALRPDGSLDPAFGPGGTGILHITGAGRSGAIAMAPDGAIVVSYASIDWSQPTVAGVVRISPAGGILTRLDLATAGTPTPLREVSDMDLGADGSVALTMSDLYGSPTSYLLRVTPALALDPSFGSGGAVSLGGLNLAPTEVVVDDTTGGVRMAGPRLATGELVTAGLTAAGSLDAGWGDGGIATHAAFATPTTTAGLFATPGGGVLVAGDTRRSSSDPRDHYLLALSPTGAADPTFGDDGWARIDIGTEATENFTAVSALPDDDLLVVGTTGDGVVAGRYDADGTPDDDHPPAVLLPEILRGPHRVADVAVAGDGSAFLLVQQGVSYPDEYGSGSFGSLVIKLDADGAVDPAFGDDGVAAAGDSQSLPRAIGVRADGTVLVSDINVTPAYIIPPHQFVPASFADRIVALTPAGAPAGITTFGEVSTPPGPIGALAVGPAGHAYVVASGQVLRMAPDGTVSAWSPLPAGATLAPADLAVDGAGRVVVYGTGAVSGGATGDVVARFGADLGLDTTFGTGGLTSLPTPGDAGDFDVRAVHAHSDGAVTVVHQVPTSPNPETLVHRLLPSGQPDPSFNGDGRAEGTLRVAHAAAWLYASAVAGPDVILAGQVPAGAFVARING